MIGIGRLCVIVAVTTYTGSRRIGIVPLMALVTGQGCMRTLNRVEAVVESRGCPDCLRVTRGAVSGELLLYVIRTVCLVEVVGVTPSAGIGCIVKIPPCVALVAVIGNGCMCSDQRIEIIVNGKCCRTPSCIGCVTGGTVSGQIQLCVVRILTLCIVIAVATVAGIGGIVVVTVVACRTVARNIQVRSCQYIEVVVNSECSGLPGCRGMATGTISGNIQIQVTGIGSLHILIVVATGTGSGCALEAGTVALKALCSLVGPREREASQVVVKNIGSISGGVTGQTGGTVI